MDKEKPKQEIKKFKPYFVKKLEEQNRARKLAGLKPIEITIQKCRACKVLFESIGRVRNCGCKF